MPADPCAITHLPADVVDALRSLGGICGEEPATPLDELRQRLAMAQRCRDELRCEARGLARLLDDAHRALDDAAVSWPGPPADRIATLAGEITTLRTALAGWPITMAGAIRACMEQARKERGP